MTPFRNREETRTGKAPTGAGVSAGRAGSGRARCQRHRGPPRHDADASGGGRRHRSQGQAGKGYKVGDMITRSSRRHNRCHTVTGQCPKSPRESFSTSTMTQQLTGLRYDNWKLVSWEQRAPERCASGRSRSPACGSEDLQSPNRPGRARGHYVEHLLRLASGSPFQLVRHRPMSSVPDDVQDYPQPAEGGQLQYG